MTQLSNNNIDNSNNNINNSNNIDISNNNIDNSNNNIDNSNNILDTLDNSNNIIYYDNINKRLHIERIFNNIYNQRKEKIKKINLNKKIENILENMENENNGNNQENKIYTRFISNMDQNVKKPITMQKEDISELFKNYENNYTAYFDNPCYQANYTLYREPITLKAIEPVKKVKTPIIKEKVIIQKNVETLQDLIDLIHEYPLKDEIEYNIDMKSLNNILEPLTELSNMIGMNELKDCILDQIIYFIQEFHKKGDKDFMHTVIYGPPGTGKTETAKIIGKIFSKMGILKKNKFKKVTRADLIAGYLGQTAIKTKEVIEEAMDGVLFIDEAYALGNTEKKDIFAKECIDTLCEALSDNKERLMVIIAGYKEQLKSCFFNYNEGLDSRFTWRYATGNYSPNELKKIFEKKVKDNSWSFKDELDDKWFEKNKDYFKFFGRDMETLLAKSKIAHSKRVFCLDENEKGKLSIKDLEKGLEFFKEHNETKNEKEREKYILSSIYN